MRTYPLIQAKLSNERLMSALLLVLLLYSLPRFTAAPGRIPAAALLVVLGLVLDAAAHFIIYKRPVCAVSAAVTALILYDLSPGTPFWAQAAALGAALILGKFVWGGTGKNLFNPAMLGLLLLTVLSPVKTPVFEPSWYLLPALLLSLPFLFIRPYAGLGLLLGMAASLLVRRELTAEAVASAGLFFWGCLVITDPVTTTSKPAAGLAIGLLAGFVPGMTGLAGVAMPAGILVSNLLSYLADRLDIGPDERLKKRFGKNEKILLTEDGGAFLDLADARGELRKGTIPPAEEILRRIEENGVFGMGGAAFPTAEKIRTVIASDAPDKHCIINAAECDPGLIHDKWLLRHNAGTVMLGIDILRSCVPFKSVTVAAKAFGGAVFQPPVRTYKVEDVYPAGAEKLLIRDVLKTKPPNGIPAANGILVLNIQTVCAVCEAVLDGRPADTRVLTVADLDRGTGKVVRVRLGADIYETARKVLPHAVNVYAGGGMMNARLVSDGDIVDSKTNFLAAGRVRSFREAVCSQCNVCSAYCPVSLRVRDIARCIDAGKPDATAQLHPEACMACNLCSAVCLAGRDQAARVREAKAFISAKKQVAND